MRMMRRMLRRICRALTRARLAAPSNRLNRMDVECLCLPVSPFSIAMWHVLNVS